MKHAEKRGTTEGVVICALLFVAGLLLEYFAGPVAVSFWAFPLNMIVGLVLIYAIAMVHWLGRNKAWCRWLSGMPMSLAVILWMLYLVLLVGIIPQSDTLSGDSDNLLVQLGFTHIVSSWFFLLNLGLFLLVLGWVTVRRLTTFSWQNVAFFCNHAGLWIALAGGVLGSADRKELHLNLLPGKPASMAVEKRDGRQMLLPFSIELKKFILEEYPPKLALVDENGSYLSNRKPEFLPVEAVGSNGFLGDWEIEITEYLDEAVSDGTAQFRQAEIRGGATALYVVASNRKNGAKYGGWVSAGNFMVSPAALLLENEHKYIVMTEREPKRFASELVIQKANGELLATTIEVNRPANVEGYHIYQSSYDRKQGRWSVYSGVMITADPALAIVYAGIFLMLAGALFLFILGPKKKINNRGSNNSKIKAYDRDKSETDARSESRAMLA